MKKLIGILLFTLLSSPAWAGVSCTLPFNFTPGSLADANQVMANYNALVTCLGNAANAGVNADITALTGLTTPIAPTAGGTTVFAGGTASGSANAITLPSPVPNNFTLTANYCVVFKPSATNTGATTLTVGSTATANLLKPSPAGPIALIGGEVFNGQQVAACFDGTQFELLPQATYATLIDTNQTVTGGAFVNPAVNGNLGILSTGITTINCGLSPLQYFTNNGTFTFAAPTHDGSCVLLMTNGATAVVPGFSGFTVGANIGDTVATNSGFRYLLSITRINGTATYFWKALQ